MDGSGVDGAPSSWTGWYRNGTESGQGVSELGFPVPTLGKMQGEAAGRAGEPSGKGEEPPPEGLGGHDLLTQTDARRPAGQRASNCLECQEEQSTTAGLMSRHGQPCLSMELRMTSSLRIQATKATLFGLPVANSFW